MVDFLIRLMADWLMIPTLLIGSYALIWKIPRGKRLESYKRVLMAGLTAYFLSKIIGYFYQPTAERPFEILGVSPGASYLTNAGFPSDHILLISALLFAVWFEAKQLKIAGIMLFFTALISIGRVLALVHTPMDIIGGVIFALIGCIWYVQPKNIKK